MEAPDATGGPLVLAAGANQRNLELLSESLRGAGYSVRQATDAEGILEQFTAEPGALRLLVLDLDGMPREVGRGCQRAREAHVPVVALARVRTEEVETWAIKHGVRTLLEKPVRRANLLAIVSSFVDR